MCHAPVLAAPDSTQLFILEIDASFVGGGAVLLQETLEGFEHPVSYF